MRVLNVPAYRNRIPGVPTSWLKICRRWEVLLFCGAIDFEWMFRERERKGLLDGSQLLMSSCLSRGKKMMPEPALGRLLLQVKSLYFFWLIICFILSFYFVPYVVFLKSILFVFGLTTAHERWGALCGPIPLHGTVWRRTVLWGNVKTNLKWSDKTWKTSLNGAIRQCNIKQSKATSWFLRRVQQYWWLVRTRRLGGRENATGRLGFSRVTMSRLQNVSTRHNMQHMSKAPESNLGLTLNLATVIQENIL